MSSSSRVKSLIFIMLCVTISVCSDLLFTADAAPAPDNSQLFYSGSPMRMGDFDLMPGGDISAKLRRRVSGFVPMRGKKDIPLNYMEQPPRELDQDPTLSRLANAMDAQQQRANSDISQLESVGLANNNWQPVVAVPRQFFYQMTNHHQDQSEQQSSANNANNNWQAGSGMPNPLGWGQQATNSMLMEAKLRRAFHPMRGKRASLGDVLIGED